MSSISLIAPIDGRYAAETRELAPVFSEQGLFAYRLKVEIEYFIALGEVLPELGKVSVEDQAFLRKSRAESNCGIRRNLSTLPLPQTM